MLERTQQDAPSRDEARAPQPARQGAVTFASVSLDTGSVLAPVTLAYESWGRLNAAADNVILLCHALTGNAHARDDNAPDDPRAGWWNPLIGSGRVFDTDRYCVICVNVLGSCYGSTGPASPHPLDGQTYRLRFPFVTIGDMVRAQRLLLTHFGIERLVAVVGGSLGGVQALEWAVAYPEVVTRAIIIAATPRLGTQGLAIDDIARQAIMADPGWQHGNYTPGDGPVTGLIIARMLAMLTYSTAQAMEARFGRQPATRQSMLPRFGVRRDVDTYLHHQGEKLVERYDANSYLYLTNAMDDYDVAVGPGRGTDEAALSHIRAAVLAVGINSDWLYPPDQVRALTTALAAVGGQARYAEIQSPNGHDAFLQEWQQLESLLRPFLASPLAARAPPR